MHTTLLQAHNKADILQAVALLQAGELVAVPTETVYGLAANARNPAAVKKIFAAKERPATHPLIVHLASAEKLPEWAASVPEKAWKLAAAFWPGPLTLLLPKAPQVSEIVTGGLPTIGLRVPAHPVLREVLALLDTGLAAPSANPHLRLSPTTAQHVLEGLNGRIAAVLDGGACTIGVESTIVDCTGETLRILRSGPISATQIAAVLGEEIVTPQLHQEKVAGNMQRHYQPRTPARLLPLAEILQQNRTAAVLHYTADEALRSFAHALSLPAEKSGYAAGLYAALHHLDALHCPEILIETPPDTPEWADIGDRLSKATAKN